MIPIFVAVATADRVATGNLVKNSMLRRFYLPLTAPGDVICIHANVNVPSDTEKNILWSSVHCV